MWLCCFVWHKGKLLETYCYVVHLQLFRCEGLIVEVVFYYSCHPETLNTENRTKLKVLVRVVIHINVWVSNDKICEMITLTLFSLSYLFTSCRGFWKLWSLCNQVSLLIRRELFERAKDFNIILDDVAITELSFSREYTAAVESKQVGELHTDEQNSSFLFAHLVRRTVEKACMLKLKILLLSTSPAGGTEGSVLCRKS